MQRVGKIGSVVEPIITPKAKRLVAEAPIYFNQYIPGVEDGSLEVIGVFFDDLAEKLNEMAQKDTTKDGKPTQGKGMMVEVLGKLFTERYKDKNDGRIIKKTKMYIYDVCYPNLYGKPRNTNNQTSQSNPQSQQQVVNIENAVVQTQYASEKEPVYTPMKEPDDPLSSYNQFVNE